MHRRRFLAGSAAATAGLAGCAGVFDGPRTTASASGPPRLHVDGAWLADPDGNRVVLRGVNVVDPWWGSTYADLRGKGYWETVDLATDRDAGWYTDVLRVPIEPRSIRRAGLETVVETYLDRLVEVTRERGVYLLVDYHAIERYDTATIDRRLRAFWNEVGPRYAEESHVLYELFNEPTRPAGDGIDTWRTWRETAQPWVDRLREHAPETPIVVGSPSWSSMVRFAPEAPFAGADLLYTAHVFPSWDRTYWEPYFGDPALDVPVFLDEFGYIDVADEDVEPHMIGTTDGWGRPFQEWLRRHPNVNWAAWVFDSEWMPRMFDADWNLLGGQSHMGQFVKDWLAAARDRTPRGDEETGGPPEPPGSLTVADVGTTTATLSWTAPRDPDGDPIAQYRVTGGDGDPQIVRGGKTSARLRTLAPGRDQEVSVIAVDGYGGRSDPATVVVRTARAPSVAIPRAPASPTIDGEVGEVWDGVQTHAIDTWLVGADSGADLAGTWRALWDDRALYVLVAITDGDAVVDSERAWNDDAAEIYLDLDASGGNSYDGENDLQLIYPRGAATVQPGANSVTDVGAVSVATTETDGGWRLETAIPWDAYGVAPGAGHRIGFDVHAIDDEDGDAREAKRSWFAETDTAWETPGAFGAVELAGES